MTSSISIYKTYKTISAKQIATSYVPAADDTKSHSSYSVSYNAMGVSIHVDGHQIRLRGDGLIDLINNAHSSYKREYVNKD